MMHESEQTKWQLITGQVVPGHQVASGLSDDTPYPAGTIALQRPFFRERGLDLSSFFSATLNVSIAPRLFRLNKPAHTLRQVAWTPRHPPEDFSFAHCQLHVADRIHYGLVYYPHPETKARHYQDPSMLELLLPFVAGLAYGSKVVVGLLPDEIRLL